MCKKKYLSSRNKLPISEAISIKQESFFFSGKHHKPCLMYFAPSFVDGGTLEETLAVESQEKQNKNEIEKKTLPCNELTL